MKKSLAIIILVIISASAFGCSKNKEKNYKDWEVEVVEKDSETVDIDIEKLITDIEYLSNLRYTGNIDKIRITEICDEAIANSLITAFNKTDLNDSINITSLVLDTIRSKKEHTEMVSKYSKYSYEDYLNAIAYLNNKEQKNNLDIGEYGLEDSTIEEMYYTLYDKEGNIVWEALDIDEEDITDEMIEEFKSILESLKSERDGINKESEEDSTNIELDAAYIPWSTDRNSVLQKEEWEREFNYFKNKYSDNLDIRISRSEDEYFVNISDIEPMDINNRGMVLNIYGNNTYIELTTEMLGLEIYKNNPLYKFKTIKYDLYDTSILKINLITESVDGLSNYMDLEVILDERFKIINIDIDKLTSTYIMR